MPLNRIVPFAMHSSGLGFKEFSFKWLIPLGWNTYFLIVHLIYRQGLETLSWKQYVLDLATSISIAVNLTKLSLCLACAVLCLVVSNSLQPHGL